MFIRLDVSLPGFIRIEGDLDKLRRRMESGCNWTADKCVCAVCVADNEASDSGRRRDDAEGDYRPRRKPGG